MQRLREKYASSGPASVDAEVPADQSAQGAAHELQSARKPWAAQRGRLVTPPCAGGAGGSSNALALAPEAAGVDVRLCAVCQGTGTATEVYEHRRLEVGAQGGTHCQPGCWINVQRMQARCLAAHAARRTAQLWCPPAPPPACAWTHAPLCSAPASTARGRACWCLVAPSRLPALRPLSGRPHRILAQTRAGQSFGPRWLGMSGWVRTGWGVCSWLMGAMSPGPAVPRDGM